MENGAAAAEDGEDEEDRWGDKGIYFRGIIALLVFISFVVGASGVDTIKVIFTAQIVNGFLLPVVALCLLVCLNDESLMRARPTTLRDNCCLLFTVAATIFLASDTLVGSFAGASTSDGDVFIASLIVTLVLMCPIVYYVRGQVKGRDGTAYSLGALGVSPNSPRSSAASPTTTAITTTSSSSTATMNAAGV